MESKARMDERTTLAGAPRPRFAKLSVPAAPVHGAPIDRAHLARYTLGDATLEREILGLFVAQLPLTLESLRFAPNEREWHTAAHTLKGSARAVGAWTVASLAEEAEQLTEFSNGGAVHTLLQRIERAIEEVEAWTDAECRAVSPACA